MSTMPQVLEQQRHADRQPVDRVEVAQLAAGDRDQTVGKRHVRWRRGAGAPAPAQPAHAPGRSAPAAAMPTRAVTAAPGGPSGVEQRARRTTPDVPNVAADKTASSETRPLRVRCIDLPCHADRR